MFVTIECVVVVTLCVVHVVDACMCAMPPPANEVVCRADRFVIKGTVVAIRRRPGNSRAMEYYTIVEEEFSLPAMFEGNRAIYILALIPDGFSCSQTFDKGESYLITGSYINDHFQTSYCHRSAKWEELPLHEIEALRNHPPCNRQNLD